MKTYSTKSDEANSYSTNLTAQHAEPVIHGHKTDGECHCYGCAHKPDAEHCYCYSCLEIHADDCGCEDCEKERRPWTAEEALEGAEHYVQKAAMALDRIRAEGLTASTRFDLCDALESLEMCREVLDDRFGGPAWRPQLAEQEGVQ